MDSKISDYVFSQFGIAGLIVIGIVAILFKLSTDFAKLRTELQQQFMHDLVAKRTAAYDALWSKMRPLAIYDQESLSAAKVQELSRSLSDWYFGGNGGLFLSTRTREFYFALQDVLDAVSRLSRWECRQRPSETRTPFMKYLANLLQHQPVEGFDIADLKKPTHMNAGPWRNVCKLVAAELPSFAATGTADAGNVVFAVLQQVSSILRSNLADGLNTRLEVRPPTA